jgi:hypothetical protein
MSVKRTACVRMEEGYMRVAIDYTDTTYRSEICKAIGQVEKELNVTPEVVHKRVGENSGSFNIEFGGDDYVCSRVAGDFIDKIIKKLNITTCE